MIMKVNRNCLRLLSGATVIMFSTQSIAIASNSLKQKNNQAKLIAQAIQSNPNQEVLVPNPVIRIDGQPVQPSKPSPPPYLPRAVAPPVGDISVSNVNIQEEDIDLGTNIVLPRLVLKEAPVKEVLTLLARVAGFNLIFRETENAEGQEKLNIRSKDSEVTTTITLDIENESVQDLFNYVIKMSGLKAYRSRKSSRTIFVGESLPYSIRSNNLVSRTLRVNQASSETLASNLALLGATVQLIVELFDYIRDENGRIIERSFTGTAIRPLTADNKENQDQNTPLPLKELNVSADERTNSITLTGTPNQVQIATNLIMQADVRLRQVAVNVKVVDVQLDRASSFGSSFSFGIDNTGIVQDGGVGVINFGTNNRNVDPREYRTDANGNLIPAFDEQITETINNSDISTEDFSRVLTESLQDNLTRSLESQLDQTTASDITDELTQSFSDTINRTLGRFGNTDSFSRDQVETLSRDLTESLTESVSDTLTRSEIESLTDDLIEDITTDISRNVISSTISTITRTLQGNPLGFPNSGRISPFGSTADPNQPGQPARVLPGRNFNVPQAFLAQIRSNVTSGNAKILTDPTLVVQEGQTGTVELVENVVTSINTQIDGDSGVRTTTPILEAAGLTLTVEVDRVDDNGFISLQVSPTISAPGNPQVFESGDGASNTITPLVQRSITSGLVRLRDGQTLILSGIIQDGERTNVSKIPILGDLPLIGSLFRSTFTDTARSEVIVLLTPQILNDADTYSGFGYNYTPSRETGEYLRDRGLTVPTKPY